jgi:hypothetical protein
VLDVREPEHFLSRRLRILQRDNCVPLISSDLDDTLVPFGAVIGDKELSALTAYLETGAHIAFNTLAPKEWFYYRVMEPMIIRFHQTSRIHLLKQVHWIVSGGQEIFVYEHHHGSYRRTFFADHRSKAEGLWHLLRHLPDVALLAFYGDRFDDTENDGNAIGHDAIPLVINVGADQQVRLSTNKQVFLNTVEKGPSVTLRHLAFLTAALSDLLPHGISTKESAFTESSENRRRWRFERANVRPGPPERPFEVEVEGPGFVWSWNEMGESHLTALIRPAGQQPDDRSLYIATLPQKATAFTFFWTGGDDTKTGRSAGH